MEAYRIIKKSKNRKITIPVPENMNNMELEIIMFPIEKDLNKKYDRFDPSKYKGIWKDENLDAETISMEMRRGWQRNT